jgi:hypothetical protein
MFTDGIISFLPGRKKRPNFLEVISTEWESDNFLFSTGKSKLDRDLIYRHLSGESYWAKGIPTAMVDAAIDNSL